MSPPFSHRYKVFDPLSRQLIDAVSAKEAQRREESQARAETARDAEAEAAADKQQWQRDFEGSLAQLDELNAQRMRGEHLLISVSPKLR